MHAIPTINLNSMPWLAYFFASILGAVRNFFLPHESTEANRKSPPRAPVEEHAAPRDCVQLIDASPSMDSTDWPPTRLEAAKEGALAFVKRLESEEPDARVAIVSYSFEARVHAGLTPAKKAAKLSQAISQIESINCTNIHAGLEAALQVLKYSARPCQVVLLTDGHHNTGPDPIKVAALARKKAVVECIGIGGSPSDVDEELLKDIASARPDGTKRYRWIGDKQGLVRQYHDLAGRITRQ